MSDSDKRKGFGTNRELAIIAGRKGGVTHNSHKGWGSMTPEKRAEYLAKAKATRQLNKLKKEEITNENITTTN